MSDDTTAQCEFSKDELAFLIELVQRHGSIFIEAESSAKRKLEAAAKSVMRQENA